MQKTIIRKSRKKLFGTAVMSGLFILYYFIAPYEKTRIIFDESPKFTILLGVVFFGIFLYAVVELIAKKGEIILSEDGIDIRHNGWNHWDYVNSFKIFTEKDSENSDTVYLLLQLKDQTEIKCMISDLDKSTEGIIDLIRLYKTDIIYAGWEMK